MNWICESQHRARLNRIGTSNLGDKGTSSQCHSIRTRYCTCMQECCGYLLPNHKSKARTIRLVRSLVGQPKITPPSPNRQIDTLITSDWNASRVASAKRHFRRALALDPENRFAKGWLDRVSNWTRPLCFGLRS